MSLEKLKDITATIIICVAIISFSSCVAVSEFGKYTSVGDCS